MHIPECYDAVRQFEARDRVNAESAARRPRCSCCGDPIQTETALDLRSLGLPELVCQRCVDRHIRYEEEWLTGGGS